MNIYGFIKEASITDYIDSDALYQVLKDCPMTSHLELVECYDDMTIKMKGDLGFEFFKVVKGPEGLEAYKIAEHSGEKLGDAFPLTSEEVIEESSITVGDKFKNAEGVIIEVVEPTNEGRPQFNITTNGNVECRDTDSYETLNKILSDNGYEKFTETESEETYESIEAEIEKIEKQLEYCDRRDEVCATFGAEAERAELEAKLAELKDKLDSWDGEKFLNDCSLKDNEIPDLTPEERIENVVEQLKSGNYNIDWLLFQLQKAKEQQESLNEGSLRGSVYTEIVRSIDDACSEEMDTEEIRKFLQDLMGYIRGTAEAYDVMVESTDVDAYLMEAPNPENTEANELIKSALKDAMFAYKHQDELKKLGIDVEYQLNMREEVPTKTDSFYKCFLVGQNGRKLACNTSSWDSDELPASRVITRDAYEYYGTSDEENTVATKSYKASREDVMTAKKELPTLKKRLKLYERRYGKDSSQYRELVDYIKKTERTIERGIQAHKQTDYRQRPSENVDFKNYLDKEKIADRPKPYEAPSKNPTVQAFQDAKAEEKYQAREEELNKRYDDEDAQRIADMAKRAADEKSRRDARLNAAKERTQATLKEIRDRIEASKKRGEE